jgi:hypothetical protein
MVIQLIKNICIGIIIFAEIGLFPGQALSQQRETKGSVFFKINNYKKKYSWTDNIVLHVENLSNVKLWYCIGEEIPDDGKWIETNLDITNPDPRKEVAVSYTTIEPHTIKTITFNIKSGSISPRKKHGISAKVRFFIKYGSRPAENANKIVSREFVEQW